MSSSSAFVQESIVLLSSMKDEGPFLVEFVAHHMTLGFDDMIIVTNPSDDGTSELASSLSAEGYIKHLLVSTPDNVAPQLHAYSCAMSEFDFGPIGWLMVLDADELLNVHIGEFMIRDVICRLEENVDLISFNWACFGNYPHDQWVDASSSASFFYRLRSEMGRNSVGKSIFRKPSRFGYIGAHGPASFREGGPLNLAFYGGWIYARLMEEPTWISKRDFPLATLMPTT